MNPIISVSEVDFGYETTPVVENISLTIYEGEYFGLLGPNGSGKTTLLKLMLGLLPPDQGTVELFGEPAETFQAGERLGYVSQDSSSVDRSIPVTVREVVRMGRFPHVGLNDLSATDENRVDEALDTVGIADLADRRIGKLSGGQRQRTYIARAVAAEADLLALDEPTVGVDAEAREQFYAVLDRLHEDGITIVLIEHDLGTLTEQADRVACIDQSLQYVGDVQSFLESSAIEETFGPTAGALTRVR